jgi:hypothetical protein
VALLALRSGIVVVALALVVGLLVDGTPQAGEPVTPRAAEQPSADDAGPQKAPAKPTVPRGVVTIAAVGDIAMGSTPRLPPAGGRTLFDAVETDLGADVVLGNLEGTLTNAAASSTCRPSSTQCFAFRTPPSYARNLRDAGFTVLNLANDHTNDYGETGLADTVGALERAGLGHTGLPGDVARQTVGGLRVAVVGFSTSPWSQSMTDLAAVRRAVKKADAGADVVVVTAHMGGEGVDRQRVQAGTERYLGENRGDPVRFAHTAIDAGADLVVGHGPHVLRGMEWYRGRLIAYSLGNFAGYGVFALGGPLSVGAILRVSLAGDGSFETGVLVPTKLVGKGLPALDELEEAHGLVRSLSRADFGPRRATVSRSGMLGHA